MQHICLLRYGMQHICLARDEDQPPPHPQAEGGRPARLLMLASRAQRTSYLPTSGDWIVI